MSSAAITEEDLQAYVDGRLSPERNAEVQRHLSACPEDAARVQAYIAHRHLLRSHFDAMLAEPLPGWARDFQAGTDTVPIRRANRLVRGDSWRLLQALAAVLLLAVTVGSGWIARGYFDATGEDRRTPMLAMSGSLASLPRQAAIAHVVYSPDVVRPVEINADQEGLLVNWLSKRMGTSVRPPRLAAFGFELIGGRLLPGGGGPVAQFMYHDITGQRITVYITTERSAQWPEHADGLRYAQEGPVNVFYWGAGHFGYALSAGIGKNELRRVALAVYEQSRARSS